MSISIPDYTGLPPIITAPVLADWRVTPQKMHFFWLMGTAAPENYNHRIQYNDFRLLPLFSDYQDWLFEASVSNNGSVPICNIDGGINYAGSLGLYIPINSLQVDLPISFLNLNLLSAGNYDITIVLKVTALNPLSGLREIVSQKVLPMIFAVKSSILPAQIAMEYPGRHLMATNGVGVGWYSALYITYTPFGAIPTADIYYFTFPSTINPPVVTVDDPLVTYTHVYVHPYFSKIVVSFGAGISGFAPSSTHNFNMFINDLQASIRLSVLNEAEVGETLYTSPESINFVVVNGVAQNIEGKIVYLNNVDEAWSISGSLPAWLQVSAISGTENAALLFDVINVTSMEVGTYSETVTFLSGENSADLLVTMTLRNFLIHDFAENKLSFCQDLDYISIISESIGTFVKFVFQIKVFTINSNEPIVYGREYVVDLFNGVGSFHLGTVVGQLLEEIKVLSDYVPDTTSNYWRNQFLPAEITGTWEELEHTSESEIAQDLYSGNLPLIKMLPGHRPYITNNQMGLLTVMQQQVSRITPKSVIGIGFCHLGTPRIVVKRNNATIDDFIITSFPAASGAQQIVYSYFRFANQFVPGDSVEILVSGQDEIRSQRYLVMREGISSTFLLFENKNGIIEPFELTGRRRTSSGYTHSFSSKYKELFASNEKQSSEVTQSMIVNTGNLLPMDFALIDAVTKSLKVWVSYDSANGPYFRATVTTSKLQVEDTLRSEISYDLEINILENTNAVLYPR